MKWRIHLAWSRRVVVGVVRGRGRIPIHVGDLVERPQVGRGIAMAIKAPTHGQRLRHLHNFHFVDAAVTRHAPDAAGNMGLMAEVGVVGQLVDANPFDGLPGLVALTDGLEALGVQPLIGNGAVDELVAVHARGRGRNGGVVGSLHGVVAVATIQSELAHVKPMAVGHGLNRAIAHVGKRRRKPIPNRKNRDGTNKRRDQTNENGNVVGPAGEDYCHGCSPFARREREAMKETLGKAPEAARRAGEVFACMTLNPARKLTTDNNRCKPSSHYLGRSETRLWTAPRCTL